MENLKSEKSASPNLILPVYEVSCAPFTLDKELTNTN